MLATNAAGCTRTYTWVTDVFELPDLDLTAPSPPYCSQTFRRGAAFCPFPPRWNVGREQASPTPWGDSTPVPVGEGFHTVLYTYTDVNGCTSVDSMGVTVIEPDTADAGYDQVLCADAGQVQLGAVLSARRAPGPGRPWPTMTSEGVVDVARSECG